MDPFPFYLYMDMRVAVLTTFPINAPYSVLNTGVRVMAEGPSTLRLYHSSRWIYIMSMLEENSNNVISLPGDCKRTSVNSFPLSPAPHENLNHNTRARAQHSWASSGWVQTAPALRRLTFSSAHLCLSLAPLFPLTHSLLYFSYSAVLLAVLRLPLPPSTRRSHPHVSSSILSENNTDS